MSQKSLEPKMETIIKKPFPLAQEAQKPLNLEYALELLKRLFNALRDATGDPATAIDVIEKITEGIEADPEFSKQILTPENIAKAYALKAKADAGTIKLDDLEAAFPVIAEKVPFWGLIKTFKL